MDNIPYKTYWMIILTYYVLFFVMKLLCILGELFILT